MATKLESILKPVPWFLILKAAVLGVSFYFLPFWLFSLIGIYFYFSHLFGSFKLLAPFFLSLGLAYFSGPSFWLAFFLAIIFFLILGIKELVFIDRASAYEVLVYLLILLLSWDFFSNFLSWQFSTVFWAIMATMFLFLLLKGLIGQFTREDYRGRQKEFLFVALVSFLVWQLNLILLLLPLNYFYQTALSLLVATILIDFLLSYFKNDLSRRRILVNFSFFFVLVVIILASAQWRI